MEVRYSNNIIPKMTDYTTDGITIRASNVNTWQNTRLAWKAFDGNVETYWETEDNVRAAWLEVKFTKSKRVKKYEMMPCWARQKYSKNWTFEGSIDGEKWVILDKQINKTHLDRVFPIENSDYYIYYRLNISAINGESGYITIGLTELAMFEALPDVKFLIKQSNKYCLVNFDLQQLGQPIDNAQLSQWYNKHGVDNINILIQNLSNRQMPITLDETTGIWKTDFELDANQVLDNIEMIENEDIENSYKIIKYDSPQYRLLDQLNDNFEIMMATDKT